MFSTLGERVVIVDDIYSNIDICEVANDDDDDDDTEYAKASRYVRDFIHHCMSTPLIPIRTGWNKLDELLGGGLYPGVYTIGGGTGIGKTTLMIQLCRNIIRINPQVSVMYFGVETTANDFSGKVATGLLFDDYGIKATYRGLQNGINGKQCDDILSRIQSTDELERLLVYPKGAEEFTPKRISTLIVKELEKTNTSIENTVVLVDYLQILSNKDTKKDIRGFIDDTMMTLSSLSTRYGCPIVVTAAVNRLSSSDTTHRFHNSSMKESGGIEYTSDVTLFLEPQIQIVKNKRRNRQSNVVDWTTRTGVVKDVPTDYIRLTINKNRNGRCGCVPLKYAADYACISEDENVNIRYNDVMDEYITTGATHHNNETEQRLQDLI